MAKQLVPWFLALCALPAASQADVLLDENFNELTPENNAVDVGAFKAQFGLSSSVDIVSGAECPAPASGNCVQLNGSGPPMRFGVLQSKMSFSPGTYFVSFDLINPSDIATSATVTLGETRELFQLPAHDETTGVVKNADFTVGSIGSPQLVISSGGFNIGAILDNVIVSTTPVGVGVPEPATLGLLALGIAGVGFATRRRP